MAGFRLESGDRASVSVADELDFDGDCAACGAATGVAGNSVWAGDGAVYGLADLAGGWQVAAALENAQNPLGDADAGHLCAGGAAGISGDRLSSQQRHYAGAALQFHLFPAVIALLGACLSLKERDRAARLRLGELRSRRFRQRIGTEHQKLRQVKLASVRTIAIVLVAGVISSGLVVSDLTFEKPYSPDQVAKTLTIDPELPHLISVAYADLQDVALGLSFASALHEQADEAKSQQTEFVFLPRSQNSRSYKPVWKTLATLEHSLSYPLNLWVIGPGLKRKQFPEKLALSVNTEGVKNCTIDPNHYHRRGIPYQLYRCRS